VGEGGGTARGKGSALEVRAIPRYTNGESSIAGGDNKNAQGLAKEKRETIWGLNVSRGKKAVPVVRGQGAQL